MGLDNPLHIAFLVVILLLVFGARRLPEIGRSLGSGMREFKQSITGESSQQQQQSAPPALPAAQQQPSVAGPQPPVAVPQQQQDVSVEGSIAEQARQQPAPAESQHHG
jgi:sec-independent protein translocase protein TatA